jgi:RNA polymerase subunit RPABC4/transcription elongation factor Spt4
MNLPEFICPECGSRETGIVSLVEREFVKGDAWSAILQEYQCPQCHSIIPAHLAERWDNLTVEQAQKEWRDIYRDSQPEWD